MKKTITIYCRNPETQLHESKKVEAERVNGLLAGFNFWIHTDPYHDCYWSVTEETSGRSVAGGASRDFAITKARAIVKANRDNFPAAVANMVEANKKLFPVEI
jgi:hypothetical protein